MKYLLSVTLAILVAGVFLPTQSVLASCAATSPEDLVAQADIIVEATAGQKSLAGEIPLTAQHYLKGRNLGSSFSLRSPVTSATSVDVQWLAGETYVVFLNSTAGKLRTTVCDGTGLWAERSAAVKALEPGEAPANTMTVSFWPVTLLVVSMLGSLGFSWWQMKHASSRAG